MSGRRREVRPKPCSHWRFRQSVLWPARGRVTLTPTPGTESVGAQELTMLVSPLAGQSVLIADDKPEMIDLYRRVLERAGARVIPVADGDAAVSTCDSARRNGRPFDAALIDLVMPGGGGMGTAATLRIEGFDGGLVGLSAFVTPEISEYWLAAGCDAVLPKTVPHSTLVATLVEACTRREGERAAGAHAIAR